MTTPTIDSLWKGYQIGQGSADHTAKEVFAEVIGPVLRDLAAAQERIAQLDACVNGEVPHGALNALGRWLAPVLNEDQWPTAERFLNAALLQLLESEQRAEEAARDAGRYRWLADTVLSCDYGDNNYPGKAIGWRVMPFFAPVAYGETIDAAIDAALAAKGSPADPCPQCVPGGTCSTAECKRKGSSELMRLYGIPSSAAKGEA